MEDLRILKTKKALYEAIIELMKDNAFEDIKVSDICEKAMVNRSTFYAHYQDKYDLISSFISTLTNELKEVLNKNTQIKTTKEYYLEMINLFLTHIEKEKDSYAAVLINNRNSIMMDMIYNTFTEDVKKHLEQENELVPSDIESKFYLGAVFNVGIDWLNNKKYSKEDLLNYLNILIPDDKKN
jgi:AcrR family transcriptional regulator